MKLPRQPAAVIFDMDGLLFDTERLYEDAAVGAATSLGYEMSRAFFRTTVGSPWLVNRALLLEHYGEAFPVDELRARAMRTFKEQADAHVPLKPGAIELLELLDVLRLPRAIATTSFHPTVQHHLKAHDLVERFHHIVANGDYVNHKPAPDPYMKASKYLNVAAEFCLALEDSHNGVRSASSAGMMTIMIPDLLEPTAEIRSLCTFVLHDLHAVRELIRA
jgi:HAD superfamily hydrolase (TIGR01509 family)